VLALAVHDDATLQLAASLAESIPPSPPEGAPSRNLSKSCVHPHKTMATTKTNRTDEGYLKSW
jgi:hypothetical protein